MVQFRSLSAPAVLSLMATAFHLVGCSPPHAQTYEPEMVGVRLHKVGFRDTNADALVLSGYIDPGKEAVLGFEMGGLVKEVRALAGRSVRKGETLARLESAQLNRVHEGLLAAESLARATYERLDTLYRKGSIPEMQLLGARSQYEQARAALLASAEQVGKTSISSPFDGYVTKRSTDPGSITGPMSPLIHVADLSTVRAVFYVSEHQVGKLNRGDSAEVRVDASDGIKAMGTVTEVGLTSEPQSASYVVKVSISNPDRTFLPGMACRIKMLGRPRLAGATSSAVVCVPSEAVMSDNGQTYVFTYELSTSTAQQRKVSLGGLIGDMTEIISGLSLGDEVIIGAGSNVSHGKKVGIIK